MIRLWKWWLEGSEKMSEVNWLAFQRDHWMQGGRNSSEVAIFVQM